MTLGLICFAVLATVVLLRTRRTADAQESAAQDEAAALRGEIERLKTLLLAEPQVLVAWAAGSDQPEIFGDTGIVISGAVPEKVLAFGAWLEPAAAQRMQHAVDTLRNEGRGFMMTLTSKAGRPLEAEGRAVAGRAVLRLRDVSGIESELMDLASRHDRLLGDVETMQALLDALPAPIWARGADGRLIFVNAAYARAVEAEDSADAVTRELELLDHAARDKLSEKRADGALHRERLAGDRRRQPAHLRRGRRAERCRFRRHGGRCHRGRSHAQRACAHDRGASPRARPARHRRRYLQRRPQADLLQFGLPLAV